MKVTFLEIREDIYNALLSKSKFIKEDKFSLIEGFIGVEIWEHFNRDLDGIMPHPGVIPMVGLVGDESGRLYIFSLKALLPHIEI